ncbi:microtubule-associated protein 10 [Plectropomus leopardus]|uniref:microtubule-associated protein 10 n=1 Tax=Plectropomus leopardus TaxID=160734 RepID=UPI001C4CAF06|nr:microtubule-associated protein 10 [Plectropomus leopardus]
MMSGRQNSDNIEILFSFELLVECIRVETQSQVSDELALGVRLLDFPTLLIYQPPKSSGDINQQGHHVKEQQGEYTFNRGKSCFFKMNLNSLHTHLSNTPLYAMVLDVKEEIPKLVGTSLISLAKVMDRVMQDVTEHGVTTPSSHGERGAVCVCNLMGEKIGSISLSYKLLSLGASLHITERRDLKSAGAHGVQHVQQSSMEKNTSAESLPPDSVDVCSSQTPGVREHIQNNKPSNENIFINEIKQDNSVCVDMQKPQSRPPQTLKENNFEDDLSIFCPPLLFYSNSAEDNSKNEGGDYKILNLDSEAFTSEDSEEETGENKSNVTSSLMVNHRARHENTSKHQETSGTTPSVLGDALRQLPLLNALLVELSQLNGQNQHQPLSIHPNLSWIYRPASTEPSAGHRNTPQKAQTKLLQKTRQGTSPHSKHLHSPRYCSTPVVRPASVPVNNKQEKALTESKSSSKSPQKKLVYGTTKTFNLRLKQISPLRVKRRECIDLIQNETQSKMTRGKTKSSKKSMKPSRRKSTLNQSSSLNENIETVIQSVTADSKLQETIALKQKTLHGKIHGEKDRDSLRILEKPSLSERDFIQIPRVDCDTVAHNKDKKEHHSESNEVKSQCEADKRREEIDSSGSSRHISPKSSFSDSSRERNEEEDYADDFNSFEPSDAYSPDPVSSPEPSRAKTPRSPVRPDFSNSEGFQRRAVLPVPIKAPSSPQRALRGTHIIRPRTKASALSFSSDDGDRDGTSSLQTICSRKQMTESSRVERSSGGESFISSRGQRSGSSGNSGPVRGFSAESVSSFERQEIEELEDELGSLDFKKEYRHISELVANKLPGYTM